MLSEIKYPKLMIAIPPKINYSYMIDNDIPEFVDNDLLEIEPSRPIAQISRLIGHIYDLKDKYYRENERDPEYLLINERNYKDIIWYFSNQNQKIDLLDDVIGLKIVLINDISLKVVGKSSEELINRHRKD